MLAGLRVTFQADKMTTALKGPTLPGMVGMHHLGFTVPNIEQATAFLVEVLGCEVLFDRGRVSRDDDWMRVNLNVDSRSVIVKVRWFRCGTGSFFEVFEYQAPDQRLTPVRNSDAGGHHVALHVRDIDAAVAFLTSRGVVALGAIKTIPAPAPNAGMRWIYVLAPWGMQFELIELAPVFDPSSSPDAAARDVDR